MTEPHLHDQDDAIELVGEYIDLLGEWLFKFDWHVNIIGHEPTFEKLLLVGLRARVIKHEDFRICVYPNDHSPPHFHVYSNGEEAAFSIRTGERLKGYKGLKNRDEAVKEAWQLFRKDIAVKWNETRPTNAVHLKMELPVSEWEA